MTRSNCLLAVDAGNTNVVFGLFQGDDLLKTWRMATLIARTSDEYTAFLHGCMERLGIDSNQIFNIMVASVVPPLDLPLTQAFKEWIQVHPDFVRPGLKTGLPIHYDPPQDVGADRIVNAVAAKELYGSPAVVVDFGTATTFDVISSAGAYEGGMICPGVQLSVEILHSRAARLPRVDIRKPENLVGKSTQESIRSGIFFGYLSMVDGILKRLVAQLSSSTKIIATGGYASLIGSESEYIQHVDPDLTLYGLKILHERNR